MERLLTSKLKDVTVTSNACLPDTGPHITPASLLCLQLWRPQPLWWHSDMELSFPLQLTLSSQIGPVPPLNVTAVGADVVDVKFNIRHTTSASLMSHPLLQTRPHTPFRLTSTRPWFGKTPSVRRIPETVDKEQHHIVRRSLISFKLFTIYKHLFITWWNRLSKFDFSTLHGRHYSNREVKAIGPRREVVSPNQPKPK